MSVTVLMLLVVELISHGNHLGVMVLCPVPVATGKQFSVEFDKVADFID
jgi:hypothetical protein